MRWYGCAVACPPFPIWLSLCFSLHENKFLSKLEFICNAFRFIDPWHFIAAVTSQICAPSASAAASSCWPLFVKTGNIYPAVTLSISLCPSLLHKKPGSLLFSFYLNVPVPVSLSPLWQQTGPNCDGGGWGTGCGVDCHRSQQPQQAGATLHHGPIISGS